MSKQPFFASAPRLSLKIDGARVGYAIGLTLNISVTVEPIKVLGMFETLTLEPLAYLPVSGSMRIIKLLPSTQQSSVTTNAKAYAEPFTTGAGGSTDNYQAGVINGDELVSRGDQSFLYAQVSPGTILLSKSFDIDVMIKRTTVGVQAKIDAAAKSRASKIAAAYQAYSQETDAKLKVTLEESFNKLVNDKYDPFNHLDFYDETSFMSIRDCRITGMDSEISPARLMEESVTYQGLLAISQNEAMDYIKELQ